MSIIIDQFEVVLDSQRDTQAPEESTGGGSTGADKAIKPQDIQAVIEQFNERCERVRAH